MKRLDSKLKLFGALLLAFFLAGCATGGTGVSVGYYGAYYDNYWGYGSSSVDIDIDNPGGIGPGVPHPAHPIALPPDGGARPEHPIATPKADVSTSATASRSVSSSRPATSMRGGGGRGGGRR